MEILKELAYVVTKNKLKSIEILGTNQSPSRINTFYDQISKNKFSSDEEASEYFFPNRSNGTPYRKLKAKLKHRLINTLFFIDVKQASYNDRRRAYYQCYKDFAATQILLGKNARKACIDLSLKVLRYAEKFEFNELCRDITRDPIKPTSN